MPKLWNDTIKTHRQEVRDAILDTVAEQVAHQGLQSMKMSQIAEETGIGRATLYKYFPDIEAILVAWHERQVSRHVDHLVNIRDHAGGAAERLHAVLEAFALISHEHRGSDLAALLHQGEHIAGAQRKLSNVIQQLVIEGAKTGDLRNDVAPAELANFCLHALAAARTLPSQAAVRRLVTVTLAGLNARTATSQPPRRRRAHRH